MLYLGCDPIPKAVENEDDLDDVPVAGHEEEERDTDAGEQIDGSEQRDADASEQRDAGGEERDVADSKKEKEVDSDEWFINFSCMMNEVEAKVETDGYHSEELNIPISSDDEDEDVEVYPQYSQSSGVGEQKLELGMEFGTLDEFKSALREYSILMDREFKWKKNDKQRARAKCKKAFCDWEIYCAKNEVRNYFQIKTFKMQPTLKCVEALEYFKQEFGVHIEVTKMWRAMKEAKKLVEGNERKQYAKVFDYAHELLRSNPGSTQWKSKELKGIVWQCAKSTTVAEFEGHMAHLKTINCQAWEYLNKWPKQAWTKAHFSTTTPKVDNICNNTCEVFNSRILQYRCKPIITMLEEIRSYIMRTMAARKVKLSGKSGPLCPV
ncbi:hypothetical protein HKD37_02G004937 [Glycine soja]